MLLFKQAASEQILSRNDDQNRQDNMDPPTGQDRCVATNNLDPFFLIAISGCSSSGKSTLAATLAHVFTMAFSGADSPSVTIISQDNYFIPKPLCPPTSFVPHLPDDERVVEDAVGPDGRVSASDVDCLAAVDWARLHRDVDEKLRGGENIGTTALPRDVLPFELYCLMLDALGIVSERRLRNLARHVRRQAEEQAGLNEAAGFAGSLFRRSALGGGLACRLVIVEGFLLFASEDGEEAQGESGGDPTDASRRRAMAWMADERVFLDVDRATAAQRRFGRASYVDEPLGARRRGEVWRARGYFEDVAWPNYERYHRALLLGSSPEPEIRETGLGNVLVLSGDEHAAERVVRRVVARMVVSETDARERAMGMGLPRR